MIPLQQAHPFSRHRGPVILGHEVVGRIIEKGSAVEGLQIGDRVVPGSGWWCGECALCRAGRINICERYFLYGIHYNGGLAEQAIFPAKMCVKVPAACSNEAAVLAQATAVAVHAWRRVTLGQVQRIALFGVGNIGSLLLGVFPALGGAASQLIAIDVDERQLATAKALGATHLINAKKQSDPVAAVQELTDDCGVDLAIEATGMSHVITQALRAVCRGGTLLQVGIPAQPVALPLAQVILQEKTLMTTNGQICTSDLPQALHLLTHTDLAARIETHIIPFARCVEDGFVHRMPGKIIVIIGS